MFIAKFNMSTVIFLNPCRGVYGDQETQLDFPRRAEKQRRVLRIFLKHIYLISKDVSSRIRKNRRLNILRVI